MGTKLPRKLEQTMQIVCEQIKLARLRRNLSVVQVAECATCSPLIVLRREKGAPTVSIGVYLRVLYALQLDEDILWLSFRDLKSNVNTAIKLFSNSNNLGDIIRPPYEEVKKEYRQLALDFLKKYPNPSCIDILQSEKGKKNFVLVFRDIIRKHAEIQIYEDYNEDA